MGSPAARLTDIHQHGPLTGPVVGPCEPTVLIAGLPAARVSDLTQCGPALDPIAVGSANVLIGGFPAARLGDPTVGGGVLISGATTVLIGTRSALSQAFEAAAAAGTPLVAKDTCTSCKSVCAPTPPFETGLGPEVDALAAQSPSLQADVQGLQSQGWRIRTGDAGAGTYADREALEIVIDANDLQDPERVVQGLAHEVGHATYAGTPDFSTRQAFVDSMLADEGAATLNNVRIQREILTAGGPDIGIAGNPANHAEYEAAYDEFLRTGDGDAARARIGRRFATGETASVRQNGNLVQYEDYYGDWYDTTFGPPREE